MIGKDRLVQEWFFHILTPLTLLPPSPASFWLSLRDPDPRGDWCLPNHDVSVYLSAVQENDFRSCTSSTVANGFAVVLVASLHAFSQLGCPQSCDCLKLVLLFGFQLIPSTPAQYSHDQLAALLGLCAKVGAGNSSRRSIFSTISSLSASISRQNVYWKKQMWIEQLIRIYFPQKKIVFGRSSTSNCGRPGAPRTIWPIQQKNQCL